MKKIILLFFLIIAVAITAQCQQSLITLKNGTQLKGVIKTINPADALTMVIAGVETSVKMSEVSLIEPVENDSVMENQIHIDSLAENTHPNVTEKPLPDDFKVFLLEKGNNVYVWGEDNIYGRTGANELKRLLKEKGFWNVVNSLRDAHFSINYGVKFKHRDQVILSISSWLTNEAEILDIFSENGMEKSEKHIIIARDLFKDYIMPLQERITNGVVSKKIKKKFCVR